MNIRNATYALASLALGLASAQADAMGSSRPIDRFLEVSPGVYRGGRPNSEGMDNLAKLGVKTIIDLEDSSSAIKSEEAEAQRVGIEFHSFPMNAFKNPKDEYVDAALELMADPASQPVFVHCHQGRDRTGMMVGIYRVVKEGMDPAAAWKEMLDDGFRKMFAPLRREFEERTGYQTKVLPELFELNPGI